MKKFKKGERVITENGQGKVAYDQQGKYLQVRLTASGETDRYHEGTVLHDSVHDAGSLSISIPDMHGLHSK
jgi:hypothetical protein